MTRLNRRLQEIRLSAMVLSLLGALLCSGRAEAHLFEFYVDGYGGGMYGSNSLGGNVNSILNPGGMNTGADFYHLQSGGLLGAKVGMELFYTDLYLQFDQFFNSMGAGGSSLQLMLGWDGSWGATPGWHGTFGGYGGFVFGFPYTVNLPVQSSEVAALGVALELQGGAEYHFNRYLVFQALGTVGYHYLWDRTEGATINATGMGPVVPTSHGIHLLAKVGLRFHLYAL